MNDKPFWRGVFSDSGEPSFSRVITAIIVIFSLGWVTAIVWGAIRRGLRPELPDFMGLIAFVSIFYAVNKGASIFTKTP